MQRSTVRELMAEFLGTFVLIVFGCGSVAQVLLSGQRQWRVPVDQHRLGVWAWCWACTWPPA